MCTYIQHTLWRGVEGEERERERAREEKDTEKRERERERESLWKSLKNTLHTLHYLLRPHGNRFQIFCIILSLFIQGRHVQLRHSPCTLPPLPTQPLPPGPLGFSSAPTARMQSKIDIYLSIYHFFYLSYYIHIQRETKIYTSATLDVASAAPTLRYVCTYV